MVFLWARGMKMGFFLIMKQSYENYRDEITDDILFRTGKAGEDGMRKSELDSYLNRIYKNKLGNQYDEYSFDTTAYFIYKRLQKEKLLEIRNNSAWIALTDEGRKAALQGYVRYKDGKNNRRITWSNLFSKVNLSIDTTKNILWIFIAILSLFALLGLPKGHSILTKLLQALQALI